MKRVLIVLLFLTSCVERFEFSRNNPDPQLVIESYVSDMSFNDALQAPSNGRYFIVKLKFTRPVGATVKDSIAPFAEVKLIDDLNNEWVYVENFREWGTYFLPDKDFKVSSDRMYKLNITTRDDLIYESSWEQLPPASSPVEDIWFEEEIRKVYEYPAGEQEIRERPFINISTSVPALSDGQVRYYKWEYSPMWVYEAPLANGEFVPFKKCWVTSQMYLDDYTLQEDAIGGFEKTLFSLAIDKNERLFFNFSVLVFQQSLSRDYFNFWKLVQEQTTSNGLFDAIPTNLPTNFSCLNDPSKKPLGYFGVISETAKRWYFSKFDLSYPVENYLLRECLIQYGRPGDEPDYAPACLSCLEYPKGDATLLKPEWWVEK
ncbi:DUF4249 domain-containing protein [Marinoscillum sp. MHG1-6]|uniref:DUF4249 domain-containing protein n=1 Tax=Marinoscillum sp. MHG1-6 TaxID=2959627 RepID=UPI00215719B2|nr:DUF4249 domain-containing protein [Marinoscillum sp. MHG1-6]